MTKERLLPALAVLLVLAELAMSGAFVRWLDDNRHRVPYPATELPAGSERFAYGAFLPFFALLVAAALTVLLAVRSHPWTERDPSQRYSPWTPMITALGGLLMIPLFFLAIESEAARVITRVVVFVLAFILLPAALHHPEAPTPAHLYPWKCPECKKWNAADLGSCHCCSAPRLPAEEDSG